MKKQPKLMSLSRMKDILANQDVLKSSQVFVNEQLAIIHGSAEVFRLILTQQPPFSINDHRMGIVLKGEARINLNLLEKHFTEGTMAYIGPGSIINPVYLSPDFEIAGMAVSTDYPLPFPPGQLPAAFNGQERDFQVAGNADDVETARIIIGALQHIVQQDDYNPQTAASLIAAQMHHYDGLFRHFANQQTNSRSREQTVFDRFIYLVNQHAQREHHIRFYADKMCLTDRYLGTVVRQASGTTAKEWIDRALVNRIKVELRHSDKSIALIAEEMNFANASFFCKYFKRMTGLTPFEYKQS